MADLTDLQAAGSTKVVGSDTAGLETNAVGATVNGDLKVSDGVKQGGVYGNLNLPTANVPVEAKVGVSRLTNRKLLVITTLNSNIWWGTDSAVSVASGQPLANGQTLITSIDPNSSFELWLVGNANTKAVRITEIP